MLISNQIVNQFISETFRGAWQSGATIAEFMLIKNGFSAVNYL
jgi:hypothetical protein